MQQKANKRNQSLNKELAHGIELCHVKLVKIMIVLDRTLNKPSRKKKQVT